MDLPEGGVDDPLIPDLTGIPPSPEEPEFP